MEHYWYLPGEHKLETTDKWLPEVLDQEIEFKDGEYHIKQTMVVTEDEYELMRKLTEKSKRIKITKLGE